MHRFFACNAKKPRRQRGFLFGEVHPLPHWELLPAPLSLL